MLDQLLERGVLSRSEDGDLELAVSSQIIPASAGWYDSLDKWGDMWSATGWAFDPETRQACLYAFPVQAGKVATGVVFRRMFRPDVNYQFKLPNRLITGFSVSFRPMPGSEPVTLMAVLPSGEMVLLPGPGTESAEHSVALLTEVTDLAPAWRAMSSRPLYVFPQDSKFHGIHSFEASFNPKHLAGVTDQFLEDAAVYHAKYTNHAHWTGLLSGAFSRAQVDVGGSAQLSVLDIGCGSGNTVIPLLKLLPRSKIVASDISPPLLALLRDQIPQDDRKRVLVIAMDAGQRNFEAGAFDLAIGAAILHHIIDPSETIGACAHSLKPGGHAIFFEPFEEGYLLLRLLYEQLIEHKNELKLSEKLVEALQTIIVDCDLRKGSDKSPEIYEMLDDKWSFTRTYFEQQKAKYGYSGLKIYELYVSPERFSAQLRTHVRLILGAGPEAVSPEAWEFVRAFEGKMSVEFLSELLMEGCIILTK